MRQSLISAISRSLDIERPTCLIGIAVLFGAVLPVLVARATGYYPPILAMTLNAIFHGSHFDGHDSWAPIGAALRYLADHKPDGLYQATYWHSADQFIYSPLSLAFCRLTQWPPLLDWTSPESLNRFFRGVLAGNVILIAVLFNDFYRVLDIGTPAPGMRERAARILIPVGAALLFFPLLRGYWLGNVQTGLTFLIILSLLLWLRGHRASVGVCLGVVCIFKPALAPLLLWALLRREYRAIWGFLAFMVPIGLVSLWLFGWGVHADYLSLMSYLSGRGESFFASHSINSLLNRAVFNGPNLVWDGTPSHMRDIPCIRGATTITSLGFIALALVGRRQESPAASWLDYAIALLCVTLASPVIYEHHLGFTLPLFMMAGLMLAREAAASPMPWVLGFAYFLMTNFLEITDESGEHRMEFPPVLSPVQQPHPACGAFPAARGQSQAGFLRPADPCISPGPARLARLTFRTWGIPRLLPALEQGSHREPCHHAEERIPDGDRVCLRYHPVRERSKAHRARKTHQFRLPSLWPEGGSRLA